MRKYAINFGFTLAEVLITLGVIGVVAAMTMPTLIQNYQQHQTVTQLKKVYSTLNQAYRMSEAHNGQFEYWEKKADIGATAFYEKYWKPYLKGTQVCLTYQSCGYREANWQRADGTNASTIVDNATDNRISFYLNNGTFVSISNLVYVDLNGPKKPNRLGRDVFEFYVTSKGIQPYGYDRSKTKIIEYCDKNGNGIGNTCASRIILLDNWQIKDGYPW